MSDRKEYIEREAARAMIETEGKRIGMTVCNRLNSREILLRVPATDVVEVVRCSACRFNVANMERDPLDDTDYSGRDIVCGRFLTDGMNPDDYCSYGERKDGADSD